jgi:hypothetical protein
MPMRREALARLGFVYLRHCACWSVASGPSGAAATGEVSMNNIIYIVGLVVVILAVLYFFGLA